MAFVVCIVSLLAIVGLLQQTAEFHILKFTGSLSPLTQHSLTKWAGHFNPRQTLFLEEYSSVGRRKVISTSSESSPTS